MVWLPPSLSIFSKAWGLLMSGPVILLGTVVRLHMCSTWITWTHSSGLIYGFSDILNSFCCSPDHVSYFRPLTFSTMHSIMNSYYLLTYQATPLNFYILGGIKLFFLVCVHSLYYSTWHIVGTIVNIVEASWLKRNKNQ